MKNKVMFPKAFNLGFTLMLVAIVFFLVGCSSSGSNTPTPPNTSGTSSGISFSGQVQSIFVANCVICHQGATGPAGLSLQTGSAYKNLVNAPSTESPLVRVSPGQPDKSYILNKLQGTQSSVGGGGLRMPANAQPLQPAEIGVISQWISQGALNN